VCDECDDFGASHQGAALRRQGDPIRETEDLYHRMGWLMQDVCRGRSAAGDLMPAGAAPADAEETDASYLVDINLPGVAAEDLDPGLRDNQLRIYGEVKDREHTAVPGRRVSDFKYLLALPWQVDPNKVEAKLFDGVLTEALRKSSADKPRRIEITS